MQTTMNLLETATGEQSIATWTKQLGLSAKALYNARDRGHLSPAIAGAMAKIMGEPVEKWICIAALESEKDSACKTMLVKEAGRTWLHT